MANVNTNTERQPVALRSEDDLARAQIDAQIAIHEAAIIRLKSKRNELSYIARLPPEVLCKIFLAHIEQQGPEPTVDSITKGFGGAKRIHWIAVTHVCRHWKEVCLSCPELWSNITFSSSTKAPMTLAMLERSNQAPISVTIHASRSSQMEPVIVKALSQVSRLKSLTIFDTSADIQEQLKNMTGEASCLENLQLDAEPYGHQSARLTIPTSFLAGGSPKLRRISISAWQATWSSPFLKNLTFLNCSIHRFIVESAWSSTADFISALRNMPMLEELRLENTFPNCELGEGSPAPLSRLRRLRLSGTTTQCAGALNCMALPPSTILEIDFRGDQDTLDSNTPTLELLSALHLSWMSNPLSTSTSNPFPPFTSFQIIEEGSTTTFSFFLQHIDLDEWEDPPEAPLTLISESYHGFHPTLQSIASALPLHNIRSLSLNLFHPYGDAESTVMHWLGQLQALQSIVLCGVSAVHFISFLKQDPAFRLIKQPKRDSDNLDTPVAITYLPALKSLKLSRVDFVAKPHDRYQESITLDVEDLLDVLMWRYEHGGEIEKLSLEWCCDLWKEDVNRIREVVVDVRWDGVEKAGQRNMSVQGVMDDDYYDALADYGVYRDDDPYDAFIF